MGYEDNRIKGKINDSDRCRICGLLCSINFFIETKCYHLFCEQCFIDHLIRHGHSNDIRDKKNYNKYYHQVRCPISGKIIEYKNTKGALLIKILQYYNLSKYKIKCQFYSYGCYNEIRTSKLNYHYQQECFFTTQPTAIDRTKDHYLFHSIDFCPNNLYEELYLRPVNGNECIMRNFNEQFDTNRTSHEIERYDHSERKYEKANQIENNYASIKDEDNLTTPVRSNKNLSLNLDNDHFDCESNVKLVECLNFIDNHIGSNRTHSETSNELPLLDFLRMHNEKFENSSLNIIMNQDMMDLKKLKHQLDVLQNNLNFIREQLPEMKIDHEKKI